MIYFLKLVIYFRRLSCLLRELCRAQNCHSRLVLHCNACSRPWELEFCFQVELACWTLAKESPLMQLPSYPIKREKILLPQPRYIRDATAAYQYLTIIILYITTVKVKIDVKRGVSTIKNFMYKKISSVLVFICVFPVFFEKKTYIYK